MDIYLVDLTYFHFVWKRKKVVGMKPGKSRNSNSHLKLFGSKSE